MTQYAIRVTDGQLHQVYRTETGIDRSDVGEPFRSPRLAGQYADLASGKPISPLRSRAMDSPTGGVTPLPPLAGVESIADAPRGRQGQSGG